jgi:DNA-binding transcriptional LysR family regulator
MLRGLRSGEIDVALLVQVSGSAPAGIAFEALRHHAVCVALPLAHALTVSQTVGLEQILDERLIGFTRADYPEHHAWIATLFAAFPSPPTVAEEHDSVTSLIAAVEAGKGIALVAEGFERLSGTRLTVQPILPAPPLLAVGLAYCEEKRSAAMDGFIAAARSVARVESH